MDYCKKLFIVCNVNSGMVSKACNGLEPTLLVFICISPNVYILPSNTENNDYLKERLLDIEALLGILAELFPIINLPRELLCSRSGEGRILRKSSIPNLTTGPDYSAKTAKLFSL